MIQYQPDPLFEGVYTIVPQLFGDERGYFAETYRSDDFAVTVSARPWVQENESVSQRGVLRGLHLQRGDMAQAKLVRCVRGSVVDVIVDLRVGSPTYGRWQGYELSEDNHRQLYIPRHFAHGFLVLSDTAHFLYKADNAYAPAAECCIRYDDPDISVPWHTWGIAQTDLILSPKDLKGISLREYSRG